MKCSDRNDYSSKTGWRWYPHKSYTLACSFLWESYQHPNWNKKGEKSKIPITILLNTGKQFFPDDVSLADLLLLKRVRQVILFDRSVTES